MTSLCWLSRKRDEFIPRCDGWDLWNHQLLLTITTLSSPWLVISLFTHNRITQKSTLLFDDFKLWNISNIYSRICEKSHCLAGLSLKIWNSSLKYLVRIIVINTGWVVVVRPFEISRLISPPQIGQEERRWMEEIGEKRLSNSTLLCVRSSWNFSSDH